MYSNLRSVILLAAICTAGDLALPVSPNRVASAAEIIVTSSAGTLGGPDCTLRDAITAANGDVAAGGCPAGRDADAILLAPGATYTLTEVDNTITQSGTPLPNGLPSVTSEITINGNGATIARSNAGDTPAFRLLHVAPAGRLTINGLTLTNGALPGIPATQAGPGGDGGGIFNAGVLTLINAAVTANSAGDTQPTDGPTDPAAGCAGRGGGVFNAGTLTLTSSIVRLNRAGADAPGDLAGKCAGAGGGIYNDTAASLTLKSSTVSGNTAGYDVDFSGGDGGGIFNAGTVVVTGSTVTSNQAGSGNSGNGGNGGGIANAGGTLTLTDSTVSANQAGFGDTFGGSGGGISNSGTVTLIRCTVSGSTAGGGTVGGDGGGLANSAGGTLVLVDSTVSGNRAGSASNSAGDGGGIVNAGTMLLANCTISGNSGGDGGDGMVDGKGGGIANTGPSAIVKNTLIAGNSIAGDCDGTLTSQGYNLIQDVGNCTIIGDMTGNIMGQDPQLGPLQDNDGATNTQALLAGSPAIDAGNPHGCVDANGEALATDQRGAPRVVGARCDIGAYEAPRRSARASAGGGGCSAAPPPQPGWALILLAFPAALLVRSRLSRTPRYACSVRVGASVSPPRLARDRRVTGQQRVVDIHR